MGKNRANLFSNSNQDYTGIQERFTPSFLMRTGSDSWFLCLVCICCTVCKPVFAGNFSNQTTCVILTHPKLDFALYHSCSFFFSYLLFLELIKICIFYSACHSILFPQITRFLYSRLWLVFGKLSKITALCGISCWKGKTTHYGWGSYRQSSECGVLQWANAFANLLALI